MTDTIRRIVLDTETTGFNHSDPDYPDRILEFAGVEMVNRHYTGNSLHLYIDPERDIPDEVIAIHNITPEKLAAENAKPFVAVAQQIFDFLKGAELLIHNATFDVSFLNAEFARVGLPNVETICQITDTLAMARKKYPGQKNTLDALCERLEVNNKHRVFHGALLDCELLGEVYLAMTREQSSMLAEFDQAATEAATANLPPRPTQPLRIILPTDAEHADHEAFLEMIDKKSNGNTLYRKMEAA